MIRIPPPWQIGSGSTSESGEAGRKSGRAPASGVVTVLVVTLVVAAVVETSHAQTPNVPAAPQTWAPVLPVEHEQAALVPGTH